MLPKFRGTSPSTSVAFRLNSSVKELRRSKEKWEKRNASTLRGNCIDVIPLFKLRDHWFSPMNVCFHAWMFIFDLFLS
jgi:hypothetical protein